MHLSTRPDRTFIFVGALLVAYGFILSFLLATVGWGGFFKTPLIVRAIGFSVVVAIFLSGVAALSLGLYRCIFRRAEPS